MCKSAAATLPVVNWADFIAPSVTNSRNPPAPDKTTGRQKSIETIACALSACEGNTDGRRDKIIALFCVSVSLPRNFMRELDKGVGDFLRSPTIRRRKNFQFPLLLLLFLPYGIILLRFTAYAREKDETFNLYSIHLHIYLPPIYTYLLYLQQEHRNCCL